jgi:hypothetical protein
MANPVFIDCPEGEWTKVATGVIEGAVWIQNTQPTYMQMFKITADEAPTEQSDGTLLEFPGMPISAPSAIDVYVWPIGHAGKVRVDAWV